MAGCHDATSRRERPRDRDDAPRGRRPGRRAVRRGRRHRRARRRGPDARPLLRGGGAALRARGREGDVGPARLRPDARPPLPDAPAQRPRRPPAPPVALDARLAGRGRARRRDAGGLGAARPRRAPLRRDDVRPRHGDGLPHGRGLPRRGGLGPSRHERQCPHGRSRDESGRPLPRHAGGPRGDRAPREGLARRKRRPAARRVLPPVRRLVHGPPPARGRRAREGGGLPRPHARLREPRRDRPRRAAHGTPERPVPRRRRHFRPARRPRARHPRRRRGASAPRGARHDRRALPVVEPQAGLRHLPRARVPRAGHPRHARRRRRSLQRPARRLHGDAPRGPPAEGAARARGAPGVGRRADGDGRGGRGARPERGDARDGPSGRLHAPRSRTRASPAPSRGARTPTGLSCTAWTGPTSPPPTSTARPGTSAGRPSR